MIQCAIISLGCPKNLVDSEQMLGLLKKNGIQITQNIENADVVIINTCGFLSASREESLANIHTLEMWRRDPSHPLRALIVAGCLVSRDREALVDACPDVDVFLDVFSREEIFNVLQTILSKDVSDVPSQNFLPLFSGVPGHVAADTHRHPLLPPHVAYLKIAEGCNRRCAFCAIPLIRGPYVSKPLPEIISEAKNLAASGVKEIILIAQDTTVYGKDLKTPDGSPQNTTLAQLLAALSEIDAIRWIRVMYLYPQNFGDDLIDAFASLPKVLPYIDIPLQHINDRVLKDMCRNTTRAATLELLEKLYARIPHLAVRTAFIVGFPGETQAEYNELLAFIRKQKFQRLGVFEFSPEEGTAAAEMPRSVPEKTIKKRAETIMKVQRDISAAWLRSLIGKKMDILLDVAAENASPVGQNTFIGRSIYDAPEIDGCVYVTGENLHVGDIISCEIIDSYEYDLIAVPVS
ncbi:MAG: 30S ribosomal protein S12 methylthiotransferase RimO [Planctomycetia bacterium]|nr:30S ribosomal protein S12 methylthiotransferase RimO [Planctomycetia bacterium]